MSFLLLYFGTDFRLQIVQSAIIEVVWIGQARSNGSTATDENVNSIKKHATEKPTELRHRSLF